MRPAANRILREAFFILLLAVLVALVHSATSTAGIALLKKALRFRG